MNSPALPASFSSEPHPGSSYFDLSRDEWLERIAARKAQLGDQLVILGHHYQVDDVIRFADVRGDSLGLARYASTADAQTILFAGVHFMAESAAILARPEKRVILPDLRAGCSMADMAPLDELEQAWQELATVRDVTRVVPVVYVNSAASLKAFAAQRGGVTCTSSNAEQVLRWAFERGDAVFFLPDQYLGRNVARHLGYDPRTLAVWKRHEPLGGLDAEALASKKLLLWDGYCSVHMGFTRAHVEHWRNERPDIRVLVHPECHDDVVEAADDVGSTAHIIQRVAQSPAGSEWAVGTEINLVNRLQAEHPDKFVTSLSPYPCLCATMYRIRPPYLLWTLDELAAGRVVNRIKVDEQTKQAARLALQRMLEITT